jgi:hypothetical protein
MARPIDAQAPVGETSAQRGRLTEQVGVGDVARMQAVVVIAPAQELAPG